MNKQVETPEISREPYRKLRQREAALAYEKMKPLIVVLQELPMKNRDGSPVRLVKYVEGYDDARIATELAEEHKDKPWLNFLGIDAQCDVPGILIEGFRVSQFGVLKDPRKPDKPKKYKLGPQPDLEHKLDEALAGNASLRTLNMALSARVDTLERKLVAVDNRSAAVDNAIVSLCQKLDRIEVVLTSQNTWINNVENRAIQLEAAEREHKLTINKLCKAAKMANLGHAEIKPLS